MDGVNVLRNTQSRKERKAILKKLRENIKSAYSIFIYYLIQFTLKIIALIAFLVLQQTLRPKSFPLAYKCHLETPIEWQNLLFKEKNVF